MVQSYRRLERLKSLFQEHIAKIIYDLKDPRIGLITITCVELSNDLREANVYYSCLGNNQEQMQTILNHAAPFVRYRLGKLVHLRRIPTIVFLYDTSIERSVRIFDILDKIGKEKYVKKPK